MMDIGFLLPELDEGSLVVVDYAGYATSSAATTDLGTPATGKTFWFSSAGSANVYTWNGTAYVITATPARPIYVTGRNSHRIWHVADDEVPTVSTVFSLPEELFLGMEHPGLEFNMVRVGEVRTLFCAVVKDSFDSGIFSKARMELVATGASGSAFIDEALVEISTNPLSTTPTWGTSAEFVWEDMPLAFALRVQNDHGDPAHYGRIIVALQMSSDEFSGKGVGGLGTFPMGGRQMGAQKVPIVEVLREKIPVFIHNFSPAQQSALSSFMQLGTTS